MSQNVKTTFTVTPQMREQALEYSHANHSDIDNGRDGVDGELDKATGNLAEIVFERFLEANYPNREWSRNEDYSDDSNHEYDFNFEGAKVDVKARKNWERRNQPCDLLVRHKAAYGGFIHPHIFVQVRLEKTEYTPLNKSAPVDRAVVTGLATDDEVANAPEFYYNGSRTYKTEVKKHLLHPMHDLREWCVWAKRGRDLRDHPINIKHRMENAEADVPVAYLREQYEEEASRLGVQEALDVIPE